MKPKTLLRICFVLGAIVDGVIAISWLLIAAGYKIPNILNGYTGSGPDYQLAMYVSAMFMAGWAVVLGWGARDPEPRKGLLPITAALLTLSAIIEICLYRDQLNGAGFVFGVGKRLVISLIFLTAWFRAK